VDTAPLEGRIMRRLVAKKRTLDGHVELEVHNYTAKPVALTLYLFSQDSAEGADPKPDFVDRVGDDYTKVWKCALEPETSWTARYAGIGGGTLDVRGVDDKVKVVVDLDV
jgi:DNA topoisomerase-6 subunit B